MGIAFSRAPFARRIVASAVAAIALAHGSASAITLEEAYQAALRNDPTYRAAVFGNEAGQENRALGRSYLLPSLSGSYTSQESKSDITVGRNRSHREYMSKSANISLRQAIFNLDAVARYRQGVQQALASESMLDVARQQLIVRVVSAYIEAIFSDDQLALAKAQRDMLAEQQQVNDRLYKAGEGTVTDRLETQAKLDMAEARLLELQDVQRAAMVTLSGIVGEEVKSLDHLREDFQVRPADMMSYEDWKAIALVRNPELVAQEHTIQIAREEVNKARAGHVPRLDFIANISKADSESISTLGQESDTKSVGFQLSVPLFSGGAVNASTRQARANENRARAELEAKSDKIMVDLRKEYDSLSSSVTRIKALNKAVESARLLMKATEQSIKGGVRINLDLLDAQEQEYMAQRDLAQARYNYLLSTLRLRAAAGTLSGADVSDVARFFR
ncbi:MAG TPA: TolC family outer membrane protein [Telluria sp.]|nr:TolC family outer membrane protein [Telluria sp.]